MQATSRFRPGVMLFGVLALLSIVHLLIAIRLPLHPDEAYYWTWSRALALSYYDQGPGIAFFIRLFTAILGDTHLALKLAATAAATASTGLVYPLARRMGLPPAQAVASTLLYALLPGIWGASLLILHDSVLMLAWNAALLLTMVLMDRLRTGASIAAPLFGLALAAGLGVLTKHTMVLLLSGIAIWWSLSGRFGRLLKNPLFYAALLFGGLVLSPLVVWNVQNDFAGVEAILFLRSSGGGTSSSPSTGALVLSQLVALSPIVFLTLLVVTVSKGLALARSGNGSPRSVLASWRKIPDERALAIIVTLVVFLFFFVFSFRRIVQGNWLFPGYATAAILFVQILADMASRARMLPRILTFALLAINMTLIALTLPGLPGPVADRLPHAISQEQRMGGFAEAVHEVDQIRSTHAPAAHLLATRYQDAAIASFYLDGQPFVSSINILMKNQYTFWPSPAAGEDFVVFLIEDIEGTPGPDFLGSTLPSLFESVESEYSGTITLHGRKAKRWKAYVARDFLGFPDEAMARIMRSRLILFYMPDLLEPGKDGERTLADTSRTLLDAISREKKRRGE